ncbi:uncharacterized protein SOCE26_080070 [Sorangium cellulosum]|uniref:Uncharacterized protein n=1 Tax=Sorangium cellulosum TaxID=56 RepID=A0A2L0F4S4_SORCE|nr:uncharacterized protein SOCE26_080070 [Sorangium cellulosum]
MRPARARALAGRRHAEALEHPDRGEVRRVGARPHQGEAALLEGEVEHGGRHLGGEPLAGEPGRQGIEQLDQGMFEKNILTFNPGWDQNAQKLASFTDIRDLQRQLKAQGVQLPRRRRGAARGRATRPTRWGASRTRA